MDFTGFDVSPRARGRSSGCWHISRLIHRALKIPAEMQTEVLHGFLLLALSVPVVISTSALRGLLEAYQRFGLINALRIPMGAFAYLGPLLVLPFSKNFSMVIAVLVAGRVIAWVAHFFFASM